MNLGTAVMAALSVLCGLLWFWLKAAGEVLEATFAQFEAVGRNKERWEFCVFYLGPLGGLLWFVGPRAAVKAAARPN